MPEPPWCFCKTQFGSVTGHVAVVELLAAIRKEFMPQLEVSDEGGYWESRDVQELSRKKSFLDRAITEFSSGLQRHGLTAEAAEDTSIVLTRIERIAAKVQRSIARPSEHPPIGLLFRGLGDLVGGLAQATSRAFERDDADEFSPLERIEFGLTVTQLKRSLRGIAFARGALCNLRTVVDPASAAQIHDELEKLNSDILEELHRDRERFQGEDD